MIMSTIITKGRSGNMLQWRKRIRRLSYIITDITCIFIASLVVDIIYIGIFNRGIPFNGLEKVGFLTLFTLSYLLLFLLSGVYDCAIEHQGKLIMKTLVKIAASYIIVVALVLGGLNFLGVSYLNQYLLLMVVLTIIGQSINKSFMRMTLFKYNDRTEAMRNILVVGHSRRGQAYIEEISGHDYLNLNIIGYINIKEPKVYDSLDHLGGIEDLVRIATENVIDEIAVARPLSYDERLADFLNECQLMGITVSMLLDIPDDYKSQVAMVGKIPVLKFHTVSLNESQLYMKRMLDIVGSMLGMVIFGIAFIIMGPLIKLESPGPIIFKQDRVGKNGRVFKVWKFRSMGVDAEAKKAALMANNEMSGHMFKLTDDPRVTRIGNFIRKTSIDELPQFYNVLRGDMSLVGTRPPTVNEVKEYERYQRKRIAITPGITGQWQVSGRSDIEDFEEVLRLDSEYIENWSFWSDIRILFKTIYVVLVGRGSK